MALVNAKVLVDMLQDDPQWDKWSIDQIRAPASVQPLAINPVIRAKTPLR